MPTSIGKLRACVYFLDQMAVSALEEAFIVAEEAMHAAAAVASELPADAATTPSEANDRSPGHESRRRARGRRDVALTIAQRQR